MSIKKILEEFVADLDYLRDKNDGIGICARYDRALLAIEKELVEGLPKEKNEEGIKEMTRIFGESGFDICEAGYNSALSDCKQSIRKVIRG